MSEFIFKQYIKVPPGHGIANFINYLYLDVFTGYRL